MEIRLDTDVKTRKLALELSSAGVLNIAIIKVGEPEYWINVNTWELKEALKILEQNT